MRFLETRGVVLFLVALMTIAILWTETKQVTILKAKDTSNLRALSTMQRKDALITELRDYYKELVEEQVRFNNWDMGCADLALLGPYFRVILDRLDTGRRKERRLMFDVGANNGQDAATIMGVFKKIVGMCKTWSTEFTVVSIEPSPQVFCELEELVAEEGWKAPAQEIIRLNVGMSAETGFLRFRDPGDEGGRLIDAVQTDDTLGPVMTQDEFENMSQCKHTGNRTIDYNRVTTVPTYTMDTLVPALESLGNPIVPKGKEIFFLKIDTEGHDKFVIQGARNLLEEKRIVFVLFEVWTNEYLREIVEFMSELDYACFIISPKVLIPVHPEDWWYDHLDTFERNWWGNGICGIRGSSSLSMLFRIFHSDNDFLLKAHDSVVMNTMNTSLVNTTA